MSMSLSARGGGGFRHIGDHEHTKLLRDAIRVDHSEDPLRHHQVQHSTHTVRKMVEVPYEETVRVPVQKKVARPGVEKKVMRGVELVPVHKVKNVHETVMEVKEEEVRGVREVWVKKKVPYTEIVKKPVKVTKTRQVPYTDYVEKEVRVTVDVPCHKVETHTGYRDDKILKTKFVEVEQDVVVEHRPIIKGHGKMRMRDVGSHHDHGTVEHGRSYMTGRVHGAEHYHDVTTHSAGVAYGGPVAHREELSDVGSEYHGAARAAMTPRGRSLGASYGRTLDGTRLGAVSRGRSLVYGSGPVSARGAARSFY